MRKNKTSFLFTLKADMLLLPGFLFVMCFIYLFIQCQWQQKGIFVKKSWDVETYRIPDTHAWNFSCDLLFFQGPGVCESSYTSPLSIQLEHQGCWSTRAFRPRFCALTCPERHCCSPSHTRTVRVALRCPHGRLVLHPVMVIKSCSCSPSSCHTSAATSSQVSSWF